MAERQNMAEGPTEVPPTRKGLVEANKVATSQYASATEETKEIVNEEGETVTVPTGVLTKKVRPTDQLRPVRPDEVVLYPVRFSQLPTGVREDIQNRRNRESAIQREVEALNLSPEDTERELERRLKTMRETGIRPDALAEPAKENLLMTPHDLERIRRAAAERGGSQFQLLRATYEHYTDIDASRLDAYWRNELQDRLAESRNQVRSLMNELENEEAALDKDGNNVLLGSMRNAALKFYKKVMAAKENELYGADREALISSGRGAYNETIYNDSVPLRALRAKYGGLMSYVFEGIVQEIDKEIHDRDDFGDPFYFLSKFEFNDLRLTRNAERARERKYITRETHYGVIYELSAENAKELPQAVLDYVKDQVFALSDTDAEGIDQEVKKIIGEASKYLDQNRIRLEEEGQKIPTTHPEFVRAKALVEAIPEVLGYEKMLYKGGEEYAPQYRTKFAANFFGHEDAIYLENPKAALEMHLLGTIEDGRYWLGQRWDEEKADEGGMAEVRREQIQQKIVEFAATHELFLSDEMTRGLYKFVDESGEEARDKSGEEIGAFEYREGHNPDKRDLKYSFDDNIEVLLLDPDNEIRQQIEATGDAEALRRHDLRVEVFRSIKQKRDNEGGLGGLTTEERKDEIRRIIVEKMMEKTQDSFLAGRSLEDLAKLNVARAAGDRDEFDRIIWKWVEDYNDYRLGSIALPGDDIKKDVMWYPSGWDRVRMNIDRPTKVLDRMLSGEELMAMFELTPLLQKQTEELDAEQQKKIQREIEFKLEEARFGFQLARSYQVFHQVDTITGGIRTRLTDPKTGKYIGKLPDNNDPNHPNFEVNKRLGLTNEQGQVINPDRKIARIFDIVQIRLQIAIEKEEAVINAAKAEKEAALRSGDQAEIAKTIENLRDIMVNSQFLATHVLKELGIVEGKLPVWSYNFLDAATMYVFTEALAKYGVEVGVFLDEEGKPLLGVAGEPITHNSKKEFYDIMERGRRALKSEMDRAAREFMEGTYPLTDEQGRRAKAIFMAADDFGSDLHPVIIKERNRMVNKGGAKGNRSIVDPRYELSTSGGVIDPELVPSFGDLGFYAFPVWLGGLTDIRSQHGYGKRGDEQEFYEHKFLDVMDLVQHAKAQAASYNARKALTGGKLANGKETPGFLMEIFVGSFMIADAMRNWHDHMDSANHIATHSRGMVHTAAYLDLLTEWRSGLVESDDPNLEKERQLTYLETGRPTKLMNDELYQAVGKVMVSFLDYLAAEKEVEENRIGNAPRNWHYDNTLKWYAFRRKLREAAAMGDRGMILRHKFSPESGSETAINMIQFVIEEGYYYMFKDFERERLTREGAMILSRALTSSEKQNGFVIPDEKDWLDPQKVSPKVRTALEDVRRMGLLEFMTEEGYSLYEVDEKGRIKYEQKKNKKGNPAKDKDGIPLLTPVTVKRDGQDVFILGNKIPAYVQQEYVNKKDSRKGADKNRVLKLSADAEKFLRERTES